MMCANAYVLVSRIFLSLTKEEWVICSLKLFNNFVQITLNDKQRVNKFYKYRKYLPS